MVQALANQNATRWCALLVALCFAACMNAASLGLLDGGRFDPLDFSLIQVAPEQRGIDHVDSSDPVERDASEMDGDVPIFPGAPDGPSGLGIEYGLDDAGDPDASLERALEESNEVTSGRYGGIRRAPYPYYDDPASINTGQPGASRWAWVNTQVGYWHDQAERRAWSIKHRQAIDTLVLGLEHTQFYTAARGDAVLLPRIWGGAALALAGGYAYFGAGASWIDDKAEFHSEYGLDLHARAEIYPVWPLGLESGVTISHYTNERTTVDWDISVKIQLMRALFFQVGYRAIRVFDHSDELRADGFFFNLNLVFSNLATIFWGPNGGPADALVTFDFDG